MEPTMQKKAEDDQETPGVGTHRVRIERAGTQLELGRKTSAKSS
jgi:hypothetical protein